MVHSAPTSPVPTLIAHRGHAREFPENTLPALRDAVAHGVTHVEFDLQLTADLVPILIHDPTLARTAADPGDSRDVRTLPFAALSSVSVHEPSRLGARHVGTPIATLADAVAWAAGHPRLHLFAEIKDESLEHHGRATVAAIVIEALAPVLQRCTVLAFDAEVLALIRGAGASIGWCPLNAAPGMRDIATALAPEFLFGDIKDFTGTDPLWPGPWSWAVYEVDDAVTARAFADRGARYIETMAVAALAAELAG